MELWLINDTRGDPWSYKESLPVPSTYPFDDTESLVTLLLSHITPQTQMALYSTQLYFPPTYMSTDAKDSGTGFMYSRGWAYQSGWYTATPNDTMRDQSVVISFSGIHLLLWGYGNGTEFDWTIDGGSSNHHPELPDTGYLLFDSTLLRDKSHTLILGNFSGNLSVGPLLIRPGPSAPLFPDTNIEVDDFDPSIVYEGHWESSDSFPSTHSSANKGDSVAFAFCGSYIAVLGTFEKDQSGSITLAFSLDGGTADIVTSSSKTLLTGAIRYYFYDTLLTDSSQSGCQHTINVTIMDVSGGQSFLFESFMYTPSYTVFGAAPNITVSPSSTSTMVSTPTSSPASNSSDKKSSVTGPVVGGVVGGLAIAGIIIAMFLLLWRRKKPNVSANQPPYPSPPLTNPASKPVMTSSHILPEIQHDNHLPYNRYLTPPQAGNLSPNSSSTPVRGTTYTENGGRAHISYFPPAYKATTGNHTNLTTGQSAM